MSAGKLLLGDDDNDDDNNDEEEEGVSRAPSNAEAATGCGSASSL